MTRYIAVLMPDGGGYRALFPDLPDCTAIGPDIESATLAARRALTANVVALIASGATLPPARPIHTIRENVQAVHGTTIDWTRAVISMVEINRGSIDNTQVGPVNPHPIE